jgi:hypothetical protein
MGYQPVANLENFIPSMMDEQANFAGVQLLLRATRPQRGQLTEDVVNGARAESEAVKNFETWMK